MAPRIGPEPEPPALSAGENFLHALPFGIGIAGKPRDYFGVLRSMWENRGRFFHARRILRHGVCDACPLGPAGLYDDVAEGLHLCGVRLGDLQAQTAGALDPTLLADVEPLAGADAGELRGLGRLAAPLVRHAGEGGFSQTTWDEALDLVAERLRKSDPRRTAWFAGARAVTHEGAFALREVSRGLGSPNLDSSARFGYAAAAAGLAEVFGIAAPTGSLRDILGSDLVVLWGVNPPATHPMLMKYFHLAREQGSRVAVVDPRRDPNLEKYWVPMLLDSAVFGTRMVDDFYAVREGGDLAFIHGAMKTLDERGGFDHEFLSLHAAGQDELSRSLRSLAWSELEKGAGVDQPSMERFAGIYSAAKSAVFLVGPGILRGRRVQETLRSIATLAAVRGMVGKKRCGIFLLDRGQEQGAVDLELGPGPGGLSAPQMIKAAQEGSLDFFFSLSGDLLEAPVDRAVIRRGLERIGLRVHAAPFLDPSMLASPADTVILLPSSTRYDTPGGSTSTSAERRVRYSPEIPGPRVAEAKPEWEIPALVARRTDLANERRFPWIDAAAVRAAIEKTVPRYRGIAGLREEGQWIQWGGERLHDRGEFGAMAGGRCRPRAEDLPPADAPP